MTYIIFEITWQKDEVLALFVSVGYKIGTNAAYRVAILILLPLTASIYPFFKCKDNTPIHSLRKIGSGEKSSVVDVYKRQEPMLSRI